MHDCMDAGGRAKQEARAEESIFAQPPGCPKGELHGWSE